MRETRHETTSRLVALAGRGDVLAAQALVRELRRGGADPAELEAARLALPPLLRAFEAGDLEASRQIQRLADSLGVETRWHLHRRGRSGPYRPASTVSYEQLDDLLRAMVLADPSQYDYTGCSLTVGPLRRYYDGAGCAYYAGGPGSFGTSMDDGVFRVVARALRRGDDASAAVEVHQREQETAEAARAALQAERDEAMCRRLALDAEIRRGRHAVLQVDLGDDCALRLPYAPQELRAAQHAARSFAAERGRDKVSLTWQEPE